nr:tyrosine-type recombinase/integrase [uncultured Methanoregula sp.]
MGKISEFSNQYQKINTRRSYLTALRAYFAFIEGIERDSHRSIDEYEKIAERYLSEDRNYTNDLINFAVSFKNTPPKTTQMYIAAVKEFFFFCDIDLREVDLRKIKKKLPKGGAATVEKIMDSEMIQVILQHSGLMMRALILLLVSSGMRIGEALTLDLADIDVKKEKSIGYISIRGITSDGEGAKGGIQRYTFCSTEAAGVIREWLKKRDSYLAESANKGKGIGKIKNIQDTRLFPVSSSTVADMWLNALEGAGLVSRDSMTNRLQIHVHMTRKFFLSQLRLAVPPDIVELLAGHSGYLSDAYRKYTRIQVEEFYQKGEPYVTIQITEEIRELRTTTEKKMQAHSEIIEGLVQRDMVRERELRELRDLTAYLQHHIVEKEKE